MSILQQYDKRQQEQTYVVEEDGIVRKIITVLSRHITQGMIFIILFTLVIPPLVYYLIIDKGSYAELETDTCLVNKTFRVPCGYYPSAKYCIKINCCYDPETDQCYHYLPSKYSYDFMSGRNYKTSLKQTTYQTDATEELILTVKEVNENTISILLHDSSVEANETTSKNKNYKVIIDDKKLITEVYRTENNDLLLTTSKGPLIASQAYWEWSFYLTNDKLFGLGQTLISLDENSTLTKVIYKNKNDHNTVPVFWAYKNGSFHGVTVRHEGPLEITVLPSNLVILRSVAGNWIELELSIGPTPLDLHQQQNGAQSMPPYWLLEPHVCRGGSSIDLKATIANFQANSDFRSDCIHENLLMYIMANDINTLDGNILKAISDIQAKNMTFVLSVPPQIYYSNNTLFKAAEKLDILYKEGDQIYKGTYLSKDVVYPDFRHAAIDDYLKTFQEVLQETLKMENLDGLILVDNWPSDEKFRMSNINNFTYMSAPLKDALSYTLPWDTKTQDGQHITKHNSYGSEQTHSINTYLQSLKLEKPIISATNIYGDMQPLIVENVDISWTNLKTYLNTVLFNSIIGQHLVSVPVCGSTNNYDKDVQVVNCMRWYLVAATMPLFRVSSAEPWRDPESLSTSFATKIVKNAMKLRSRLLSHYYGILSRNEPVVRPMFYNFFTDQNTYGLDEQYMIGDNIVVAHPFTSGTTSLRVYLPPSVGIWYELWGGMEYNTAKIDGWINIDVVQTDWVSFIAQGNILPLKDSTTLDLIVALDCTKSCIAKGTLQEEDNFLQFEATESYIIIDNITSSSYLYTVETINLYKGQSTLVCTINAPLNITDSTFTKLPLSSDLCTE